jgi:hypothetical protein
VQGEVRRVPEIEPQHIDGVGEVDSRSEAGDVVAAARPHGLVPVTVTVKAVGMAGLTLVGGYGPLNGMHGLAADNLLGADLVLADGRRMTAADGANADLYWALRAVAGTSALSRRPGTACTLFPPSLPVSCCSRWTRPSPCCEATAS